MTVELPPSLASGRFQIQERPVTAPGKCSVCGSVERSVVDFGLDIEYYGGVLICTECVASAYSLLLAVGKIEDQSEPGAVSLLNDQNYLDAGTLNEYVRSAMDSVNRLNFILSHTNPAVPYAAELPADDAGESSVVPEPVSGNDKPLVEPANEPGPDDVSGNASSIFNL